MDESPGQPNRPPRRPRTRSERDDRGDEASAQLNRPHRRTEPAVNQDDEQSAWSVRQRPTKEPELPPIDFEYDSEDDPPDQPSVPRRILDDEAVPEPRSSSCRTTSSRK